MFHPLLRCAAACLVLASAGAQSQGPRAGRVRTPVVDGGTLHLATGVWTSDSGAPGATVFNNDGAQPFFLSMRPGERVADFGRVPAMTPAAPSVGTAQGQTMNGFQFAYTTREVRGQFGYVVTFYDNYGSGATPEGREFAARIRLLDLPGAPRPGVQASWRVTVNLRHSPYEFILGRDEEGGGADARFGWSLSCTSTKHGPGGPILAGDPLGDFGPAAGTGSGTTWNGDVGVSGTGLGSEDAFWRHGRSGAGTEKSYVTDLPNVPISFSSFHLQLYADNDQALAGSSTLGTNYCDGSSQPVIFHEDFSSEDIIEGDWVRKPPATVVDSEDWSGGWFARIGRTGSLTKSISTVGYDAVTVQYSANVYNAANGQYMMVHWWDGSVWSLLESTQQAGWRNLSFDMPQGAAGNPDFQIRFKFGGFAHDSDPHWAALDDVWILGSGIGHVEAYGSRSVADNDVTLLASGLPVGSFGMFFYGPDELYVPLGIGFRCVGGSGQQRLLPLMQANATGSVLRDLDFASHPILSSFISAAPTTANFQYWHRKNGANTLTDALRIHLVE